MKVLTVCSGTNDGDEPFEKNHPFLSEQMEELQKLGVEFEIFLIKKKGILGYLESARILRKRVRSEKIDIIHAHFGLAGMMATLQTKYPVVISFIGCDVNVPSLRLISWLAMFRSSYNIFVSKELQKKAGVYKNSSVLPYGIDFSKIFPVERNYSRKVMGLDINSKICLFGSKKTRYEKNYPLAKKAVDMCEGVEIIELTGQYSKEELNLIINASDCLLLTSLREGSPQVIKEAMACNIPIVSTDVGDVVEVIGETEGCYITSFEPRDVAKNIKKALSFGQRTKGRERVQRFSNEYIASEIQNIYKKIVK